MKAIKLIVSILLKIIFISLALILFFSMMAGMYYKSSPRHIKTIIVDEDHSPLSRSIMNSIRASDYFDVIGQPVDYLALQKQIKDGVADVGVVIPNNAYRDVLNHRSVNVLTILNGTANPIVPKMSLMMLSKIIMTLNMQISMKLRVEDLGAIPNVRHAKTPLLKVSNRVFYDPTFSMESSMLPAFMGLAMQIVSMLIVLFALMAGFNTMKKKMSYLTQIRQLPLKALIPPFIISWIIVSVSISTAYFTTMYLFKVPFTQQVMWRVTFIISLFVLSMESLSYFLTLNIRNGAILAAIITLIVMPAFMYSGYLIPYEQMARIPYEIGGLFPLRYYLHALYPVFNHHTTLGFVQNELNKLWLYVGSFLLLSVLSILIGQFERRYKKKKATKINNELKVEEA